MSDIEIINKYYPYVYYNSEKIADIIKILPHDVNDFILVKNITLKSFTNLHKVVVYVYERKYLNYFKFKVSFTLRILHDQFQNEMLILDRESKLKEFFETIN